MIAPDAIMVQLTTAITATVNDVRLVVAVAHTGREPGYWRARL